ncbi:hypothetical protein [Acetobacterium wieringae]|uniref:hypothetical protein n=1 Tax=Acetobacterium wieringae TaxID=52694 RepID=UPI003158B81A
MKMNEIKRIILITHNDLSVQAGNVTLICRRAEAMYDMFDIKTECIVTHPFPLPKHLVNGMDFKVLETNKSILHEINLFDPDMIVIYGISSFSKIDTIRKVGYQGEIYLDVQGAPEEMIDFKKGIDRFKEYPKFFIKKLMLKSALKKANGAFVVTDELKNYCIDLSKNEQKCRYIKIRCGLQNTLDIDTKIYFRNKYRKLLGIKDKDITFVFSGYRKPWQKIDEIIEIFKKIDATIHNAYFCFFCNLDEQFEKMLEIKFPKCNYCARLLSFSEYYEYLCACDVGFLVRDYLTTNKVAFPNKFSDYLTSGLLITMNDAISEPFRIAEKYKFPIINCNNWNSPEFIVNIRQLSNIRFADLNNYYEKCDLICDEELSYQKQINKQL